MIASEGQHVLLQVSAGFHQLSVLLVKHSIGYLGVLCVTSDTRREISSLSQQVNAKS